MVLNKWKIMHSFQVAASKNLRMWLTKVRKIKSIYHTLNLFNIDVTQVKLEKINF